MPNWVKNILEIKGSPDEIKELVKRLASDEKEGSCFDFNKVIPMPDSLKIESGSKSIKSLAVYRYKELGEGTKNLEKFKSYDDEAKDMTLDEFAEMLISKGQVDMELGKTVHENIKKYGFADWYEWSLTNWGTKWNACDAACFEDKDGEVVYDFNTAWSAPTPIIDELAEKYPNLTIHHMWADEDMGNNTGEVTHHGDSEKWNAHMDGSSEAYRIYEECWGETDCIDIDENGNYYAKSCDSCGKCS